VRARDNPAMQVNDVVRYSRPQNEEEGKFRFRVLEIHREVENPRAHIQLICDWRIKPVEVVALTDIEPAATRNSCT
jgi:hypothetical protein